MSPHRRIVMCIGVDAATCVSLVRTFRRRQVDVVQLPWGPRAVELTQKVPLGAVVASYPSQNSDFGDFLSRLRCPESPSPRVGLVLIAAPDAMASAALYLGRGVNRVHPAGDPPEALIERLGDLLEVAPRAQLKASARIRAKVDRIPKGAFCDVANLSTSGMLLKGWIYYEVGQLFDFDLNVPSLRNPIKGQAVVARLTDVTRERFNGIGARFTHLSSSDRDRLERLVDAHLA